MATYQVTRENGAVYEVDGPEGASEADILAAVAAQESKPSPAISKFAKIASALGASDDTVSNLHRIAGSMGYGLMDPVVGGAQVLHNAAPEFVQKAVDGLDKALYEKTGGVLGHPEGDLNQTIQNREQVYKDTLDPGGVDWARVGGNAVTSLLAPSLGAGLKGAAMSGAVGGMLTPVTDKNIAADDAAFALDKAGQMTVGMVGGSALHGLTKALSPRLSVSPEAGVLMADGIEPTVGQAFPALSRIEQKAQSLPLVGDAIRSARQGARDAFGRESINKALAPLGQRVDTHGVQGIEQAHGLVDGAYSAARGAVGDLTPDFSKAHDQDALSLLGDSHRDLYDRIVGNLTKGRDALNGQTFKMLDSDLGTLARDYGGSAGAGDKQVGKALSSFQQGLRDQVAEAFPDAGELFRKADAAHAGMVRIDNASNRAVAHEGAFTPNQLLMATRATDRSARKNASAEGNALLQRWATTGSKALSDTVANSGTPERLLFAGLAGAGAALHPGSLIAGGAGWAAYQPTVQRMILKHLQRGLSMDEAMLKVGRALTPGMTGEATR